jgi:beta-phosphoglucomutase
VKITAVIFDSDGVLCPTVELNNSAWREIADELNAKFDRSISDRLRGLGRLDCLEIILETSPRTLSADEKQVFAEKKNTIYRKYLEKLTPASLDPVIKPTLTALRERGYALGVGSSSTNTQYTLSKLGLRGFFDGLIDGNAVTKYKPDPEVFLRVAKALGKTQAECLVVEDATAGIEAAKRCGMATAAISYAATLPLGAMPYEADYKLANFSDLLKILC